MLYYKIGHFKAAGVALRESLKDYPDSEFRENILYYIIKSNYKYAVLSVYSKTQERLEDALKAYKTFIKLYPNSEYSKEVTRMHDDIKKRLDGLDNIGQL